MQQLDVGVACHGSLDEPEARRLIFNIEQAPARRAARRPRPGSRRAGRFRGLDGRLLRLTLRRRSNGTGTALGDPIEVTALNKAFGTIVESDGTDLVVERAMYSNANGVTWAAGTSVLAMKLQ